MKNILQGRFGIIQKCILAAALLAMTVIWPLGAFPVTQISEGAETEGTWISGPGNETDVVRQEFVPNYEQLRAISVYAANNQDSVDTMQVVLRVYDYTGTCLGESLIQLEDYSLPGYISVPVNLKLTPGILHYYTIGGRDGDLFVAYCVEAEKTAENGILFYKDVPAEGTSVVTKYEYVRPMGLKRILLCDGLIAGAAGLLIAAIGGIRIILFKKTKKEQAERIWRCLELTVKIIWTIILAAGVGGAFAGIVIRRLFTDDVLNIAVLFLGTLFAAAWILYNMWMCKSEAGTLQKGERNLAESAVHMIRALLFAATLCMSCMYINGYTNFEKGLFFRRLLVFFALFIISLGQKKQIFNLPNLLWSVAAFFGGRHYISLHSDHIEHIRTATDSAWVMWVMGLIVIRILYCLAAGQWKRLKNISLPYFFLTLLFWIGCIVFRNGRQWTWVLCTAFSVWILLFIMADCRERILEAICDGILLAFTGTVIFCLYRRPYQYFMLTRYAGIFFTATTTATYYLVPAAAALTKTLIGRRENDMKKIVNAWAAYGVTASFMLFTASRTGIVSLAVMTLFAIVMPWMNERKGFIIRQLKTAGILVVSLVMAFIMTFSAVRMIPAIAGNPFYFWYEGPNAYITPDTPWKGGEGLSETFIDVQRLLEVLFGRVFFTDEESAGQTEADAGCVPGVLLASAEDGIPADSGTVTGQYANGRLEIFRAYYEQLNMTGHESMSALDANGEPLMHAHNSYLQAAFDFGIPIGVLFVVLCLFLFIKSVVRAYRYGQNSIYEFLPLFVIIGFGVASLFEWVYHPANPLGFLFLAMFAPLMIKSKVESGETGESINEKDNQFT